MENLINAIRLLENEKGSIPRFDLEQDAWQYLFTLIKYVQLDRECLEREKKELQEALKNGTDE